MPFCSWASNVKLYKRMVSIWRPLFQFRCTDFAVLDPRFQILTVLCEVSQKLRWHWRPENVRTDQGRPTQMCWYPVFVLIISLVSGPHNDGPKAENLCFYQSPTLEQRCRRNKITLEPNPLRCNFEEIKNEFPPWVSLFAAHWTHLWIKRNTHNIVSMALEHPQVFERCIKIPQLLWN